MSAFYIKQFQRLKSQRNALQLICAFQWAVLGWYNFHLWYFGGVVVTFCLVECWHVAVARQLMKEYRKEIRKLRETVPPNKT